MQAFTDPDVRLFLHTGERYLSDERPADTAELLRRVEEASATPGEGVVACEQVDGEWLLPVHGTGFEATLGLTLTRDDDVEDRRTRDRMERAGT